MFQVIITWQCLVMFFLPNIDLISFYSEPKREARQTVISANMKTDDNHLIILELDRDAYLVVGSWHTVAVL